MLFGLFRRRDQVEAIDADTVRRPDGRGGMEEFCLLDFDAPEPRRAKSEHERELGHRASELLRQRLAGARTVKLKPARNGQGEKMDRWKRRYTRLYINGEDVKDVAIREGWGVPYTGGKRHDWSRHTF